MLRIMGTLLLDAAGAAYFFQSEKGLIACIVVMAAFLAGMIPDAMRIAEKTLNPDDTLPTVE